MSFDNPARHHAVACGTTNAPRTHIATHIHRLAACTALLALMCTLPAMASRCYVDAAATGGDDGTTWSDAYTDLQSALNDNGCTEVWVSRGVYKPTTDTDQTISFNIRSGVAVHGGFAGNETEINQRDLAVNVSILSGDLAGDDVNADGNSIDETSDDIVGTNAHHVVLMDGNIAAITGSTILDGFTITGGDDSSRNGEGGGLLCRASDSASAHCSPTLSHLVMIGNRAESGGAMLLYGSNGASSAANLAAITFSGNHALNGGAIYNLGYNGSSNPVLTDVAFIDNSSSGLGGAMYNIAGNPTLTGVTFSNNSASYGGAMANEGLYGTVSNAILTNVTFNGNSADICGGAMYNHGLQNGIGSPTLTNVTFSNNSAEYGGAMYNEASDGGTSNPDLTNVILWNDTAEYGKEIYARAGYNGATSAIINYSIVQNGDAATERWDGATDIAFSSGTGNLDADPLLAPLTDNGGFTRTLMPAIDSPAIDAAPCSTSPITDQRGAPRPDPSSAANPMGCDIGAVERQGPQDGDLIFADGFDL